MFLVLTKDSIMRKYEVLIEENCVETFQFEIPDGIDIYDYVRESYYKRKIVLEPGESQFRQMEIHDLDDDTWTGWQEF